MSQQQVERASPLPPNLPPRCLRRTEAAAYIGVSPSLFDQMIYKGVMPKPLRFGERVFWDRHAIDRAVDEMAARTSPEAASNEWDIVT
jgi:predicted DNA-binding transcriptional regulator AlpA